MNLVKTRPVANSPTEMEFDYIHPVTRKRVRRKQKMKPFQAEMVCKLLDSIIENNQTLDELQRTLSQDPLYMESSDLFIRACKDLYFNYNADQEYFDYESEVTKKLNVKFIDVPDINISFLGKAGVGKSSIIRKMSIFSNSNINFPFIDTSRTSTYSAEYCFTSEKDCYQFAVAFMSEVSINNRLEECIERGINKSISMYAQETPIGDSLEDDILSAFYTDPAQLFDIRLCLGKHIKTSSPHYKLDKNRTTVERWKYIAQSCMNIAQKVIGDNSISGKNTHFHQEKFSEYIKSEANNAIQQHYNELLNYLKNQLSKERVNIVTALENNPCIKDIEYDCEILSCKIIEFNSASFKDFISVFTSKKFESFGNSLLPMITKMRIELPYNPDISESFNTIKIRCYDTIGIAHTTEAKGGFEKSTQLKLENIDAIIVADDSRLNMSNDTGVILKHLSARVDHRKIYFALTFFDEFTKEQFDPEENMNEQKIDYLLTIQKEKIYEYLEESDYSKSLVERVQNGAIFYLSELGYNNPNCRIDDDNGNGNDELIKMLNEVRKDVKASKSKKKLYKPNPSNPIVEYDYKKLSILYSIACSEFINLQEDIYFKNPPHFKTTEALTRRLKDKETCFYGARILKPVDNLYNALISQLSDFITIPRTINLKSLNDSSGEESDDVELVIGELKSFITDKISILVNQRFFTKEMIDTWERLWRDSGYGVASRRCRGIITAENIIAPKPEEYLKTNNTDHFINNLENLIKDCILEFEKKLDSKN